jgi:A/G-specific adenine glycosylase
LRVGELARVHGQRLHAHSLTAKNAKDTKNFGNKICHLILCATKLQRFARGNQPKYFQHFLFAYFVYFGVQQILNSKSKNSKLVAALLDWFAAQARDLPWRRTRDAYAIWVSEIMLQQTQVKTVIPFWNRWLRELPTIEAAATAPSAKIHKLWEGLGYYTRVRNLQRAAQQIVEDSRRRGNESQTKKMIRDSQRSSLRNLPAKFPEKFEEVLALPGIGRYTAGAICSIAFNQPTPILDGNVIRVLTRLFGIAENPKEQETNARLWKLAEELVQNSKGNCSQLNQSLMELGALVCTPRNSQCGFCPVQKLCVAFKENRVAELPNLGQRQPATARHFVAFVIERDGKFLVRQRTAKVVNAHLWELPNVEVNGDESGVKAVFRSEFGFAAPEIDPLITIKHSITRYHITLEAFHVQIGGTDSTSPHSRKAKSGTGITRPSEIFTEVGVWKTPAQMRELAFTAAHKKLAAAAAKNSLSQR